MRPQRRLEVRRGASGAAALLAGFILFSSPAQAQESEAALTWDAEPYPAHANGEGAARGGFAAARWAEDWRPDAEAPRRENLAARLKYIRLGADPERYLTLSGNLRLRADAVSNPGLEDAPARLQLLRRLHFGADLHWGEDIRLFGELAHARVDGDEAGASPGTFHNRLAVQQAFAELRGEWGAVAAGVRVGRQEYTDGPAHLLSARDNSGVRSTMNGVRVWLRGSGSRIGLFDFRPTLYARGGTADDRSDPARRFSGATFGVALGEARELFLEPFVWRDQNRLATWGADRGESDRYFGGARLWGKTGRVAFDWSINRQWGRFGARPIAAWQLSGSQSVDLVQPVPLRVSMSFDYASGGNPRGDRMRTADAPFGNGTYLSYGLFLTPSNLLSVGAGLSGSPVASVRVAADYRRAWRASRDDAVYRSGGKAYRGTDLVEARRIADIARIEAQWTMTPKASITLRLERLQAGPALREAGHAGSQVLSAWLALRF
ncbi:MAG: alginate export family protein [Sphingopyxis sp.]|nr:alginate export family protein [Sphingopyxis sp.]